MTYVKDPLGRELFVNFDKVWVGFEDKLNKLTKVRGELSKTISNNYPPYNIKKTSDNTYAIEIAAAGFSKNDIEIHLDKDKLTITGNQHDTVDNSSYIFKGISTRAFTRTFELDDYIEVKAAELVNGMLCIALERVIPENLKPKKIEITDAPSLENSTSKKLLVE